MTHGLFSFFWIAVNLFGIKSFIAKLWTGHNNNMCVFCKNLTFCPVKSSATSCKHNISSYGEHVIKQLPVYIFSRHGAFTWNKYGGSIFIRALPVKTDLQGQVLTLWVCHYQ